MSGFRFPARLRLRHREEFARVHQSQIYAADAILVIRAAANGLPYTRLGLSISRQVGNAVERNRWKRRIREAFRLQQTELPPGLDLVVRPRRGAAPEFQHIFRSLPRLVRRIAPQVARE